MPTYSYLYLSRKLAKFMMINFCGLVRTQKMITQKIINSRASVKTQKMIMLNMNNLRGYYMDESESKRVTVKKSESKRFNVNA